MYTSQGSNFEIAKGDIGNKMRLRMHASKLMVHLDDVMSLNFQISLK